MRRSLVALAAAALFAGSPAFAQEGGMDVGPSAGSWEFTFGGTGVSDNELDNTQLSFDGSAGYYMTRNLLLDVRQGIAFEDIGDNNVLSTRVAVDYHFDLDNAGRWRPFVGGNIGGIYGSAVNDSGIAGVEAGLKWYVKNETFLFGRGEYAWSFDSGNDVDDNFEDGQFLYTFGIGMNF